MSNSCVVCKKLDANACMGCQDTPVLPFNFHNPQTSTTTYYCGVDCQKADWKLHRKTCRTLQARKHLFRASSTLQQIYYMYREKMFDKYIVRIEEDKGKLYLHEGDYRGDLYFKEPCVFPFPRDLCTDRKDKEAILANLGCADSMCAMHGLIKHFLGDMATLGEITIMVKDAPRETIVLTRTGTPPDYAPPHGFTKVQLKQGANEIYAFDLSGAQYGFYDTLVSWEEYTKRVHVPEEVARFGATVQTQQLYLKDPKYGYPLEFGVQTSSCLIVGMLEWEMSEGMTVKKLLEMKKVGFEQKQKVLVEHLRRVLDVVFARMDYTTMRKYVSAARAC